MFDQDDPKLKLFSYVYQLVAHTQWSEVSWLSLCIFQVSPVTCLCSIPTRDWAERSKSKMRVIYSLLAALMRWCCDRNGVGTDYDMRCNFGIFPGLRAHTWELTIVFGQWYIQWWKGIIVTSILLAKTTVLYFPQQNTKSPPLFSMWPQTSPFPLRFS